MTKTKEVKLSIPGWLSVTLEPNEAEQIAAWSLYVELSTRVATQPFDSETGHLRATLGSLYSLFGFTRQVLHTAGPDVAHGPESLGPIAIRFLTEVLAPFLNRWHQPLAAHELSRPKDLDKIKHEQEWSNYEEILSDLKHLQEKISFYVKVLAEIAEVRQD